jgi:protein TonB
MDSKKNLQEMENELLEVKKSPKADLEGNKSTWVLIGYILVLAALFVAFEWTATERKETGEVVSAGILLEEEIMIPITLPEKKVVPRPPEAKQITDVLEIVEDDADIQETEIISVEDQGEVVEINENMNIVVEELPEEETIYNIVEEQPEFPGGTKALFKWIQDNLKYPSISRNNGSQGTALMAFTVNSDGSITDVQVAKSTNDMYLDKEAKRVVEAMPKWKPGKQAGKAVRVSFKLPIRFRLN